MLFEEGLYFTTKHFVDQQVWPRPISTKKTNNRQVQVSSEIEALDMCEQAGFEDCKFNAYPPPSKWFPTPPSLFLFDVDDFRDLEFIVQRIDRILGTTIMAKTVPTIVETSPGHYYILRPVRGLHLEDYLYATHKPSDHILSYGERFLSDKLTDPGHHPTFASSMIRIPGSINSKSNFKVRVVQEWDGIPIARKKQHDETLSSSEIPLSSGILPSIAALLLSYNDYCLAQGLSKKLTKGNRGSSKRIEKLLQTPIERNRGIAIWRILARYLINVRKLSFDQSLKEISDWLQMCNRLRSTHITESVIRDQLKDAQKTGFLPLTTPTKLKQTSEILYNVMYN